MCPGGHFYDWPNHRYWSSCVLDRMLVLTSYGSDQTSHDAVAGNGWGRRENSWPRWMILKYKTIDTAVTECCHRSIMLWSRIISSQTTNMNVQNRIILITENFDTNVLDDWPYCCQRLIILLSQDNDTAVTCHRNSRHRPVNTGFANCWYYWTDPLILLLHRLAT